MKENLLESRLNSTNVKKEDEIEKVTCVQGTTIWEYFKKKDKLWNTCKICGDLVANQERSIKGMKKHLKENHKILISDKDITMRSNVWEHFHQTNDPLYAICKICDKRYRRPKGSTSNMKGHLISKGHIKMLKFKENLNEDLNNSDGLNIITDQNVSIINEQYEHDINHVS